MSIKNFLKNKLIKEKKLSYYPKSKRLAIANFWDGNYEIYDSVHNYELYDQVTLTFKKNDKKYTIYSLGGLIFYDNKKNFNRT